jgi:predicted enzyme related to lactoylglutathione lyase
MDLMDGLGVVNRLDLVFYWVSDLKRAMAFYRDVLGLRVVREDEGSWAEFDAGGRRFAVHSAGDGQPVVTGGATAVFSVNDLDRAKAELAGRGVAFGHEGAVEGWARFASLQDPDGNTLQLIEYARPQAESVPEARGS